MKIRNSILLTFILIFNGLFAQKQKPVPEIIKMHPVISHVQLRNPENLFGEVSGDGELFQTYKSFRYFDDLQIEALTNSFLHFIYTKKSVPAYGRDFLKPCDTFTFNDLLSNTLSQAFGMCLLAPTDTVYAINDTLIRFETEDVSVTLENGSTFELIPIWAEDPETFEFMEINVKAYTALKDQFYGLSTMEEWSFDPALTKFEKKISHATLITYKDQQEEEMGIPYLYVLFNHYLAFPPYSLPVVQTKIENGKIYTDKNLFCDSIVYEVSIESPLYDIDYQSNSCTHADPWFYLPPNDRTVLFSTILQSIKNGKCKAFSINNHIVNFSKPLSFQEVVNAISYDTRMLKGIDKDKLKKYQHPVINTEEEVVYELNEWGDVVYKYNEYGEMELDENYNPIPVVLEKKTVIDTTWITDPQYLVIDTILIHTELVYKRNDYGDLEYDDWYNYIVEDTLIKADTIYTYREDVLNDVRIVVTDTVWHNSLADIAALQFYETWYLDRDNFSIYKQVNGITPVFRAYWPANKFYGNFEPEDEVSGIYFNRSIYIQFNH
ncbi:MAG: hypothetical protein ABIJ16_09740 [Bacteroidota bacterium]